MIAAIRPIGFPLRSAMKGIISPCSLVKPPLGAMSLTTLPGNGGVKFGFSE